MDNKINDMLNNLSKILKEDSSGQFSKVFNSLGISKEEAMTKLEKIDKEHLLENLNNFQNNNLEKIKNIDQKKLDKVQNIYKNLLNSDKN